MSRSLVLELSVEDIECGAILLYYVLFNVTYE